MPADRSPPVHTRIKTRQMLLLSHLDRERSVLRAADAAGMSQPAASKLLRELEEAMGVALFERHARGVEPNAYGEILMRRAHSVLSEIRLAHEEVEALKRGERYRVAIGSVMSPGTDLLPKALSLLARRHPQMVVSVEMDTSRPMVAKLLDGQLDIVAGHPLSRRRRLRVEDLVDHAWVLPPAESILRERINAMFLQRGLPLPARIVETSSVPMITNLLRCNDMLVALPEDVVRPYCSAGMLQVLPIELNVRMDAFGIITRRGHALSRDAEEALHALREAARAVYGRRAAT
jgi:DNA-binding transcriptional LysR family regulator